MTSKNYITNIFHYNLQNRIFVMGLDIFSKCYIELKYKKSKLDFIIFLSSKVVAEIQGRKYTAAKFLVLFLQRFCNEAGAS
jgi:hypothetical protein